MEQDNSQQDPVEQVAKALFETERKLLFEDVARLSFDSDEVRNFLVSLSEESDRALAIVAAAYADDKLRQGLMSVLNPEVRGGLDALFQGFGPLDSFSARIHMACALNWISKRVETSLDAMRKIRNEFAHRPFVSGFDDSSIAALLTTMPDWERGSTDTLVEVAGMPKRVLAPRETFHLRAGITIMHLVAEVTTAPLAIRRGLPPFIAAHAPYDELPEPIRQMSRSVASAVLTCLGLNPSAEESVTLQRGWRLSSTPHPRHPC